MTDTALCPICHRLPGPGCAEFATGPRVLREAEEEPRDPLLDSRRILTLAQRLGAEMMNGQGAPEPRQRAEGESAA